MSRFTDTVALGALMATGNLRSEVNRLKDEVARLRGERDALRDALVRIREIAPSRLDPKIHFIARKALGEPPQ